MRWIVALFAFAPLISMCTSLCESSASIQAEIQKAASAPVADVMVVEEHVASFRALRARHADDLFVHEQYQDVIQHYGIEGHLRGLTEEYRRLDSEHSGELMYKYLYARTLVGRNTPEAIHAMIEIVKEDPQFAPAHRMLAEIYASEAFHEQRGERAETEAFLTLCPGSTLTRYPQPLPDPSPLLDQADQFLSQNGDPGRIAEMSIAAIRWDEWRLQRIRPFDWYSPAYKRESFRALSEEYWRAWSIQVRCYRRAGRPAKAAQLLADMEQRVAALRCDQSPEYWNALAIMARLYAEGTQREQALSKLSDMEEFEKSHPDPGRASEVARLRELMSAYPKH
ncbi:MAG: hypothetical protein JOY54_09720 [Acidobacteriaceae bacterium]|nr:hypothetical protein [Acidobacteriaceae bacterium]